jgi:protoheme IX farnesyltransferase
VDRKIDAVMARTRGRPLPSGDLETPHALAFALSLAFLSMVLLAVMVNTLTAALTFFTLIGYAVIYTLYLKRATPQNIVWGGLAGAMPPLLGWTAIAALFEIRVKHTSDCDGGATHAASAVSAERTGIHGSRRHA